MTTIDVAVLKDHLGAEVAVSDWLEVTQERINQFAEATDDRQWIHVDTARAAAESPYKTTIAHGFLTLSLVSVLMRRTLAFADVRMAINYGANRVRFMSAVPSGTKIRGRFAVGVVAEIDGGLQVTWNVTIEREGESKPVCVVEWLVRYITGDATDATRAR